MAVHLREVAGKIRTALTVPPLERAIAEVDRQAQIVQVPGYSSMAYEQRKLDRSVTPQPRSLSQAWADAQINTTESDGTRRLSEQERKEMCYAAYEENTTVSSCINTTVKRLTSGGWNLKETVKGKGSKENRRTLEDFLNNITPDDTFENLTYAVGTDLGIYGESFGEVAWLNGRPAAIFKMDAQTVTCHFTPQGQITHYTQRTSYSRKDITFEPHQVIRWWFPSPHAHMQAMSLIELAKNPVFLDVHMVKWSEGFFKRGAKPSFWVETSGTREEAQEYFEWLMENFTGEENAHLPVLTCGNGKLHEYGHGSIDVDFARGRDRNRTEVLSTFSVPPAVLSIIESGNLGGGTADGQNTSFQYNAVDPMKHRYLAKLNKFIRDAFGITDWKVDLHYADYRDDKDVTDIQDKRIRNGSLTVNEAREESGKHPYADCGDTPIFVASKDILALPSLNDLKRSNDLDLQAKQAQVDAVLAHADTAQPPSSTMPLLQATQPAQPQERLDAHGIYQPDDLETMMHTFTAQGNDSWQWKSSPNCCDICAKNNGVTVKIGQAFPSGHKCRPAHPHCECGMKPGHPEGKHE